MGISVSVCSKALSDSELSDIYLRYDEENKTKRKLREIANNSNSDPLVLVEWLAYIAFGEDYIGMEKSYRIINECVGRIEQAIRFWKEDRHKNYTSYMISVREKNDYNDYAKEVLAKMKYEKFWQNWRLLDTNYEKPWRLLDTNYEAMLHNWR